MAIVYVYVTQNGDFTHLLANPSFSHSILEEGADDYSRSVWDCCFELHCSEAVVSGGADFTVLILSYILL